MITQQLPVRPLASSPYGVLVRTSSPEQRHTIPQPMRRESALPAVSHPPLVSLSAGRWEARLRPADVQTGAAMPPCFLRPSQPCTNERQTARQLTRHPERACPQPSW